MNSELAKELYNINEEVKDNFAVKNHMVPFINKISELYRKEMVEYYNRRVQYNLNMMAIARNMVERLEKFCKENGIMANFVMTSSLNADINLMGDSDIDISMLVENCDYSVALGIGAKLATIGFGYKKFVNPNQPLNCYYLYSKIENGIEFEVKLRDSTKSQLVLRLHNHMEQKLSVDEKMAITYGKLVFKETSKNETTNEEKLAYLIFKKLVFERYFAEIEGGFMLEVHY